MTAALTRCRSCSEITHHVSLADGGEASVQLTKSEADELELADGDIVHVRTVGGRTRIEA